MVSGDDSELRSEEFVNHRGAQGPGVAQSAGLIGTRPVRDGVVEPASETVQRRPVVVGVAELEIVVGGGVVIDRNRILALVLP